MGFRLFIDHGIQHAVLHTELCRLYVGRPMDIGRSCMWSDRLYTSPEEAIAEIRDYLHDGRGQYHFRRHSCVGTGK